MPAGTNRMGLLGGALGRLLGRRRPAVGEPGSDQMGPPSSLAGAGIPGGPGGVATVNPAFVRQGVNVNAGKFPAQAPNPVQRTPSQGIDQQRPESQTQAAQIQAWNVYRRAEKAAGRADPGQYNGQSAPG